jgi:hypothetical protein
VDHLPKIHSQVTLVLPPLAFVCADQRLNTVASAEGLCVENSNDDL